jgi:hypothetical protein
MIGNQNVFGLQIPVVDSNGVAELDGVQDLEKSMFGQLVVAHESAVLSDVREQVAFRAELNHNKGTIRTLEDA